MIDFAEDFLFCTFLYFLKFQNLLYFTFIINKLIRPNVRQFENKEWVGSTLWILLRNEYKQSQFELKLFHLYEVEFVFNDQSVVENLNFTRTYLSDTSISILWLKNWFSIDRYWALKQCQSIYNIFLWIFLWDL